MTKSKPTTPQLKLYPMIIFEEGKGGKILPHYIQVIEKRPHIIVFLNQDNKEMVARSNYNIYDFTYGNIIRMIAAKPTIFSFNRSKRLFPLPENRNVAQSKDFIDVFSPSEGNELKSEILKSAPEIMQKYADFSEDLHQLEEIMKAKFNIDEIPVEINAGRFSSGTYGPKKKKKAKFSKKTFDRSTTTIESSTNSKKNPKRRKKGSINAGVFSKSADIPKQYKKYMKKKGKEFASI